MLTRDQKQVIVNDLKDKFKRQKVAFFSDFYKIGVPKLQRLRGELKKENAEYKVAKKTLLDRALQEAGIGLKTKELSGEIGVTFGYGDEVSPAKTLLKFSKENGTFKVLGGLLGSRILSDIEIAALAKLPSREAMLTQVLGTMQFPIRGLITVLQGNIRNLVVILNKIKENKR